MTFEPMLTPKEMLKMGVFGGTYFNTLVGYEEYPNDWFSGLDQTYYASQKYLTKVNYFKVKSGQSLEEWVKKGWIHEDDPRGWFEWYCRYFLGRRHQDDRRQIKRWLAFCGPRGRWRNTIYKKIHDARCDVHLSKGISPRIQQSLLHWGYLVNEEDYKRWMDRR